MNTLEILYPAYTKQEIETAKERVYKRLLISVGQQLWVMYRSHNADNLDKLGTIAVMKECNPADAEEMERLFYNLNGSVAC